MGNKDYQVIIIGGGPAGLTAGLYTSRARLYSLLIEKGVLGGQIVNAERVENYPGFPHGIAGYELGQLIHEQATKYGLETVATEATAIDVYGGRKVVKTPQGNFATEAIIFAGGSERQKLGVLGEAKLTGKGVSYCAICDGPLFTDQVAAVFGGGDTALTEALSLARFAARVLVIHRRGELRASKLLREEAFNSPKLEFIWNTVAEEIEGDTEVNAIKLRRLETGELFTLRVAAVFVAIGLKPNTAYLKGVVRLDEGGHVITNELMETEIPGIFAAGDIRRNSARQAITAAGDGAMAALSVDKFLGGIRTK